MSHAIHIKVYSTQEVSKVATMTDHAKMHFAVVAIGRRSHWL